MTETATREITKYHLRMGIGIIILTLIIMLINPVFSSAKALRPEVKQSETVGAARQKKDQLPRDYVENLIKAHLLEQGSLLYSQAVPSLIELEYDSSQVPWPATTSEIEDVLIDDFDDIRKKFHARVIIATTSEDSSHEIKISGKFYEFIDAPVLNRRILKGDMIKEQDISMLRVDIHKIRRVTVMDKLALIGKTPVTSISPNILISENMVKPIDLIKKDDKVKIKYKQGAMIIEAEGVAIESGIKRDMIKVKNTGTGKVVDAIIEDIGQVRVLTIDEIPED